jgi:hypothetical protein
MAITLLEQEGLKTEACGIEIKGENRWKTLIQNAKLNETRTPAKSKLGDFANLDNTHLAHDEPQYIRIIPFAQFNLKVAVFIVLSVAFVILRGGFFGLFLREKSDTGQSKANT